MERFITDDTIFDIITKLEPYDLISLYQTNKLYRKMLEKQNTLNMLYDKYLLKTISNNKSFDEFIRLYNERFFNESAFSESFLLAKSLILGTKS